MKIEQMNAYGESGSPREYEEDHVIPLELGGAPRDPKNLWPEPLAGADGAHEKDRVENWAKAEVCAGRIALADAQQQIASNWRALYNIMVGAAPATTAAVIPTAESSATPSAAATPAPSSAAALSVTITASVWGYVAAQTSPGATCDAKARYASGSYSKASGITVTKTADASGAITWTYTKTGTTTKGTGTYTVTCTLSGASATATSTFVVQ